MIRKLRYKFIIILMSIATLILFIVFAAMLMSTKSNGRRISENILRQVIRNPIASPDFRPGPPSDVILPIPANPSAIRNPILVAEIEATGEITFLINQLHFMDSGEAELVIKNAVNTGELMGTMYDYGLRWLKSKEGRRIALVDISIEQEMLKNLIVNSLYLGALALTAFFIISLILSRWAVHPVEIAWRKQRQFVADASHELKTPLTVILSNADMLNTKGTFSDTKNERRMDHIMAEAMRMKNLVENLLELARSDNSERTRVRTHVDFSFILMNAVLTFEPLIFDEGKKIVYNVQDNLFVMGDEQRLQQLVRILLDNAVKYCPTGGTISVSINETNKKVALLAVVNDGPLLLKNELTQVFERFYRVDKSRSTHGSFGLGLSIASGIVDEHKGKIWADSKENVGNSFYVMLPLV